MVKRFSEFDGKVNEKSFVDWLTGKKTAGEPEKVEAGQPSGALGASVEAYYKDLEDFARSGKAMAVQSVGSMTYSKLVEEIQVALQFLGYALPKFGVDGLFGPETANAIAKFNADTQSADQTTDEARVNFQDFSRLIYEAANGRLDQSALEEIPAPGKGPTKHQLNDQAAKDYDRMVAAAEEEGITWEITDSYRDYDDQVTVAQKKGLYKQGGLAAVPGTSNHGWGAAIDLKLSPEAQAWMQANAQKYGFTNIPREPWHWEHKSSVPSAQKAPTSTTASNLTLIDANLINRLIVNLKNRNFGEDALAKYARPTGVTLSGEDDDEFYKAILTGLGANVTDEKMKFLKAWRQGEGGKAKNNPFNTTKKLPISGLSNYNSVGVKNYPTPETGVQATVATLNLPYYKNLVELLRNDNVTAAQLANCPDLNTWGSGDNVRDVLASGNVNPPAIYA